MAERDAQNEEGLPAQDDVASRNSVNIPDAQEADMQNWDTQSKPEQLEAQPIRTENVPTQNVSSAQIPSNTETPAIEQEFTNKNSVLFPDEDAPDPVAAQQSVPQRESVDQPAPTAQREEPVDMSRQPREVREAQENYNTQLSTKSKAPSTGVSAQIERSEGRGA